MAVAVGGRMTHGEASASWAGPTGDKQRSSASSNGWLCCVAYCSDEKLPASVRLTPVVAYKQSSCCAASRNADAEMQLSMNMHRQRHARPVRCDCTSHGVCPASTQHTTILPGPLSRPCPDRLPAPSARGTRCWRWRGGGRPGRCRASGCSAKVRWQGARALRPQQVLAAVLRNFHLTWRGP